MAARKYRGSARKRRSSFSHFLRRLILLAVIPALIWLAREHGLLEEEPESSSIDLSGIKGRVIRVHDGDTITFIDEQGKKIKARLWGVDAPELAQANGQEAMAYLDSLIGRSRQIVAEEVEYDQYGRMVARVSLADGRVVNREMVAAGLAWVYKRYCTTAECRVWQDDQAAAQKARLGLWAEKNPQEPWNWRRSHRR